MSEPESKAGGFVDATGKPLDGAELEKAWAEGTAHVAAGTGVHMLDEYGDLRLVPAERVAAARAKGYSPAPENVVKEHELQREHGGIGGQAATFLESAADTATVGGFGFAAGHIAPGYAHDVAERREANPYTHIAGSVAGLAPSLLYGGEGAEAGEVAGEAGKLGEAAEAAEALHGAAKAPGIVRTALGGAGKALGAPLHYVEEGGSIVHRGIARGLASLGVDSSTTAGRIATKVLAGAGGGAAEGAVFGVGSTLSESALEGKDLTPEALVSGVGRNALFGGLIGGGSAALGEIGHFAAKKLLPDQQGMLALAERKAARAVGVSGKDAEKLGGAESQRFKSTMDEMLGYEYQTGENKGERLFTRAQNVTDIHEGLRQAVQETGAAKRGIVEEIDNAIRSDPKVAAVAQPDVDQFFERVKTEVLDKLRKSDVMGQRRLADKIEKEIQPLREAHDAAKKWAIERASSELPGGKDFGSAAADAERIATDSGTKPELQRFLNENRRAVSRAERAGDGGQTSADVTRFLHEAQSAGATYDGMVYRGATEDEFAKIMKTGRADHTLSVSSDIEGASSFAKRGGVLLEIKDHPVPVDGIEGSNTFSEALIPKDSPVRMVGERIENGQKIFTLQMGPQPPAPPEPITFARLDQFERDLSKRIYGEKVKGGGIQVAPKGAKQLERVRGILSDFQDKNAERALAAMGEDPAQFSKLNRQYSSFSDLEKIAGREAGKAGKNRIASPTDHALGLSMFLGSLLSGNVGALGSMAYGAAASIANHLARTRGNSILADIAYRTSKMDNLLENTARALALNPEELVAPIELVKGGAKDQARENLVKSEYEPFGLKALHKDYEEASERVRALSEPTAQQAQLEKATATMAEHYPEQASAMSTKLLAIYQHLNEQLPTPQGGSQLSPMAVQPRVPPREQMRFLTRVNAALHPEQVIKEIADGKLDKDAVDTLRTVYPATFAVLQQKVQMYTAANKNDMPYQRVIHISRTFGFDGDSSLGPRLASIQQSIQQFNAPPNGKAPGAPGPTKRGRPGVSKIGKSFELPGQAAAGEH